MLGKCSLGFCHQLQWLKLQGREWQRVNFNIAEVIQQGSSVSGFVGIRLHRRRRWKGRGGGRVERLDLSGSGKRDKGGGTDFFRRLASCVCVILKRQGGKEGSLSEFAGRQQTKCGLVCRPRRKKVPLLFFSNGTRAWPHESNSDFF